MKKFLALDLEALAFHTVILKSDFIKVDIKLPIIIYFV